jgi:uncharacterized protein YbaR (Trm112 family)
MPIPKDLLDMIACPLCKKPLRLLDDNAGLKCEICKRAYPVRDDVPVLLIEEATIAPE